MEPEGIGPSVMGAKAQTQQPTSGPIDRTAHHGPTPSYPAWGRAFWFWPLASVNVGVRGYGLFSSQYLLFPPCCQGFLFAPQSAT